MRNEAIPRYSIPAEAFTQVRIGDHRYSLLSDLDTPDGYQCVSSDAQLIEHLRKRLSKFDPTIIQSIGVTKKLLADYVAAIDEAGLGDDEAAREGSWREAAKLLIDGLDTEVVELEKTIEFLMARPQVREALVAREQDLLREIREQREREVDAEQQRGRESLAVIREEIERANRELAIIRASLDAAVNDIVATPLDALARHGLLDALRRASTSLARPAVSQPHGRIVETTCKPISEHIEIIEDLDRLRKTFAGWFSVIGVDPYLLQVALAAVLAHPLTLISGAPAERLAVALATTLAGDRAVRASVGSAIFGLDDLMCGPITPIAATPVEDGQTLGEFLAAMSLDAPTVVVLSGCNRAPPEIVLPEFLPVYSGEQPRLAWSCRDGGVGSARLSPHLRVVATLHGGDTTHRVSEELASNVPLVPSDHRELNIPVQVVGPCPAASRIATTLLAGSRDKTPSSDYAGLAGWLTSNGVELPVGHLLDTFEMYERLLGLSERTTSEMIAALLLARADSPDLTDLPGAQADAIRERLRSLMDAPAWHRARRHFTPRED
jgi:hypothetical protein